MKRKLNHQINSFFASKISLLFGVLIFFPGISLLKIQNFGIQPIYFILFVNSLLFFPYIFRPENKITLLVFGVSFFSLFISFFAPNSKNYLPFIVHDLFFLSSAFFFYKNLKSSPHNIDNFFKGYKLAGFFSALISFLQILFHSKILYFINNTNFSLVPPQLVRGFAFTPEPSILASLLLPIFILYLYNFLFEKNFSFKDLLYLNVIFLGLIATLSQSILLFIPFFIFMTFFSKQNVTRKIKVSKLFFGFFVAAIFSMALFFFLGNFLTRFQSGDVNGSFGIRNATILLVLKNLNFFNFLTGSGIGTSSDLMLANQSLFLKFGISEKTGVDSVFFRLFYEQGILGILPFIITIILIIKKLLTKSYINKEYLYFILFMILPTIASYGYRDIFIPYMIIPIYFSITILSEKLNQKSGKNENSNDNLSFTTSSTNKRRSGRSIPSPTYPQSAT